MRSPGLTRREAVAALAAGAYAANGIAQTPTGPRRLDVHHHMFSREAVNTFRANFDKGNPGPLRLDWTPARSLEAMDQAGVRTAMLSCNIPFGDNPVAARDNVLRVTREMNDYGARLTSDHRGRFGLLAALPLPDVDSSLREIAYALDTLKADGVGLLTSYGGRWLGDAVFQPVFDELNRRRAVVYAHPITAPCCHDLLPGTGSQVLEWNTDTSRAIWSMIDDGELAPPRVSTATRCPKVTFIWSHAGGTLLGLIQRFLGADSSAEGLARVPKPNSRLYHLRRFYYDTAVSANPIQMTALKSLVGASQIVFGSDFPFASPLDTIQRLQGSQLNADELRGVLGGNALRIFPRWK
ncbi:MAG: amidohydrolase [Acidobacteria bacterium]|nr:amidohydrolase [Acidobacteriota bacterium]